MYLYSYKCSQYITLLKFKTRNYTEKVTDSVMLIFLPFYLMLELSHVKR